MRCRLSILSLLALSFSLSMKGQSADHTLSPRTTHESTLIGIGGYNLRDTYLSPSTNINYTGWVVRVMNERMKLTSLADGRISRQQLINVEFGNTLNGAQTARTYAGFADYTLGYHYRFQPCDRLKLLAGASAHLMGGFLYNTRNSNNPASGKADLDLNLSAMGIYRFSIKGWPLVLRYQLEAPFIGMLFSVHKGEPYYYLTQEGHSSIIKLSAWHNKLSCKNYFTLDIPTHHFTMRVGYLNSIYRTDVNSIKTHVISNSFLIGIAKEFTTFSGKQHLSTKEKYRSAFY